MIFLIAVVTTHETLVRSPRFNHGAIDTEVLVGHQARPVGNTQDTIKELSRPSHHDWPPGE